MSSKSSSAPAGPPVIMLTWQPTTWPGSTCAIWREIIEPQSPPWTPYASYPSRSGSTANARAVRSTPQPLSVVGPDHA